MNQNKDTDQFIRLKIPGVLNLESVASEYAMSVPEIVDFHNRYCAIQDLLVAGMAKYVEYLYLPKDKYEIRQARLLKTSNLSIPVSNCIKVYGIIIKIKPKDLQIHFRMKFRRDGGLVILEKERTYVNNKEVEKNVERLFEKAERALYPLEISLKNDGSINGIENTDEIKKRWTKNKRELQQYYTGATFENIFGKLNHSFENISKIKSYLNRSIFYNLFFFPVYKNYFDYQSFAVLEVYFASLSRFVPYETTLTLEKEYGRSGKILLRMYGEERDLPFFKKKDLGKLDILYKFNKETLDIFSITGKVGTFENGIENEISFELYDLG